MSERVGTSVRLAGAPRSWAHVVGCTLAAQRGAAAARLAAAAGALSGARGARPALSPSPPLYRLYFLCYSAHTIYSVAERYMAVGRGMWEALILLRKGKGGAANREPSNIPRRYFLVISYTLNYI